MATIAEMFVDIGADASQFEREAADMQKQMGGLQSEMRTMANEMGTSSTKMAQDWKAMSAEMQAAMRANTEKMQPFKQAQQEVQHGFFKMSQGMKDYQGSTADFMSELDAMGKKHKAATDNMLKNNDAAKMSFIQSIAVMSARSTQAEKIAANFTKMGNPLYSVNNGLLSVASSMNKIAMSGSPARLALEMLGPTANMKDLRDMTMLIQQGLMRFTMVSLIAGVAAVAFYATLNKAALEAVPEYKKATEEMKKATEGIFKPMAELFGKIMTPIVELITHVANLANKFNEAHPVLAKIIQGFLMLIPLLTVILSPLAVGIGYFGGLKAAMFGVWALIGPVVTGFAAMMGTVLLVAAVITLLVAGFIYLWNNNVWFVGTVLNLWESLKSGAIAIWNTIYTMAIKPAIDTIVSFVQSKLEQLKMFWDENGAMIMQAAQNVWNVIKNVIQVVMIAIGAIMSVAWPIIKALVISTWEAIKTSIDGVLNIIMGLIKFFAALFTGNWGEMWEATKQILLGAVQLIWGMINLWFVGKFIAGFKVFATAGKTLFTSFWGTIKTLFTSAITNVKTTVTTGFNGVKTFITTIFNGIKTFITTILNAVKTVFTALFQGYVAIVKAYINLIKTIITTVFNAIKVIITTILNAIKAVFQTIWGGIKTVVTKGVTNVKTTITDGITAALNFIKGLGSTFKQAGAGLIDMMAAGIANAASRVMDTVRDLAGKVRDMLPFSPAKDGPLSDLDKLDFGGPIADSLKRGIPTIQRLMSDMVTMPSIVPPTMPSYSSNAIQKEKTGQTVIVELDGRQIARGTLPHMEKEIRLKTGVIF